MYLKSAAGKRTPVKNKTPNAAMQLARDKDVELYSETCKCLRRATWSDKPKQYEYSQRQEHEVLDEVEL